MYTIKKVKTDPSNSIKGLVYEIESLLYACTRDRYPSRWDRKEIDAALLDGLAGLFNNRSIHVPGNRIKTSMSVLDNTGDDENALTGFALLVRIAFHDGQVCEGAGFLETAAKDPEKNTFSSMRKDHLRRLHSISQHARVMLYDYDSITGMAFPATPEAVIGSFPHTWDSWLPATQGAAVPANCAMQLGQKNTGLYKTAVPFSYQLCYRYIYGLDLDYSTAALDIARGFKTERGNPGHLVLMTVTHGGAEENRDFNYNGQVYSTRR